MNRHASNWDRYITAGDYCLAENRSLESIKLCRCCQPVHNLHELDGGLVPVGRGGDTGHVLHLGGVSEHDGSLGPGRQAVHLRAADAVVGGGCTGSRTGRQPTPFPIATNARASAGNAHAAGGVSSI